LRGTKSESGTVHLNNSSLEQLLQDVEEGESAYGGSESGRTSMMSTLER
jgi:hypothetical protein